MNRLLYTFSIKQVNLIVAPGVCKFQPRSQGSLFSRPYGARERTWERGCVSSCEGIQDSLGFWIACHGFRIPDTGLQSLSVELGLWISPIVKRIPDPLSYIPDSKA